MKIQKALKSGSVNLKGLSILLGMKYKEYPEGYTTITYDQFETPTTSLVAKECRGVIFDENYEIVCRGFDRFFNYGEEAANFAGIDFENAKVVEKLDGSLIKFWYDKKANQWRTATSGRIYGESNVSDHDMTFKDLVYLSLNITSDENFNKLCEPLDKDSTHIYEVTSPYNRIVTYYKGISLWYLGSRKNKTGEYFDFDGTIIGAKSPKTFEFNNIDQVIKSSKELIDREEGYVIYEHGIPVLKIKSPEYVRIHHIKGEDLSVGRICNLIIKNEISEYLTYFPDDYGFIAPYKNGFDRFINEINEMFELSKKFESDKDLGIAFKGNKYLSIIFNMRKKNISAIESFDMLLDTSKKDILIKYSKLTEE